MIKTVLFDVDGVLLDSYDANLKFYQNLLVKAGYTPPTKEIFTPLMHFTMDQVIRELVPPASDLEVQRIWEIGKDFKNKLYPYQLLKTPPYLNETLEKLHNIFHLGIVTSRIKEGIYTMPQLKNLKKYFTITIGFEDTKKHKPDPEPLLFACKRLNIKPAEAVYVGDAESDFLAAKAAEMKFILFAKTDFIHADNHTDSFQELPGIIASLL